MPPFSETTINNMTTTTTTTGGYIAYTPIIGTSSIGPVCIPYNNSKEEIEEYKDKTDEHIDKLEEDIDYFNRKLEQQDEKIQGQGHCIDENYTINIEQDKKIKALEDTIEFLKNYTNYLEGRIMALEDRMHDKMS